MRRLLKALALTTAFSPALASAEGSFSLKTGALSGGFLTQQDHFGFGAGQDNYFANLAYEDDLGDLRYRLSLGFDSDDGEILFDDSYIEHDFGLWTLGVGAKDRHWGPSRYTSLVLSDNTRPIPGVYVSRAPSEFESPWLSWVGDWSGDIIAGQLSEHFSPVSPKFIAMRLGISPIENLDIEFVRMVQWGGVGLDNSLETFVKLLSFVGDPNDGSTANQLAGFSVSYALPQMPVRGYLQAVGEDAAGYLPSCYFYLAGIEFETSIFGTPSTFTLEGVDTRVALTKGNFCGPNTAYRNGLYTEGYSHFGATMGAPIDTEGTSITLYGEHELQNFDLSWSLGKYDINTANLASHRLNPTRTDGLLATLGLSKKWQDTTVTGVIAYQGFGLTYAREGVGFGVSLTQSF